jgi:hypothetical protein
MYQIGFVITLNILNTINSYLDGVVDSVVSYLENIQPWAASVVLFGVGLFALIGFFVFIKKFIKAFIVMAILGGAIYLIYSQTNILDSILKIVL